MKKIVLISGALVAVVVAVFLVLKPEDSGRVLKPEDSRRPAADVPASARIAERHPSAEKSAGAIPAARPAASPAVASAAEEAEADEAPKTPEVLKEEADEKLVETFDALTDRWMEPSAKGVTMADVDAFVAQFKKVPADRKEECLQRALNLVPDENVMLLAGVLMDKSQPKELVELVFNDVLNRDEDVKKPILRQVFADKTHPCWADTAWIFDVTGEKGK